MTILCERSANPAEICPWKETRTILFKYCERQRRRSATTRILKGQNTTCLRASGAKLFGDAQNDEQSLFPRAKSACQSAIANALDLDPSDQATDERYLMTLLGQISREYDAEKIRRRKIEEIERKRQGKGSKRSQMGTRIEPRQMKAGTDRCRRQRKEMLRQRPGKSVRFAEPEGSVNLGYQS